jgi:hypothetical protein
LGFGLLNAVGLNDESIDGIDEMLLRILKRLNVSNSTNHQYTRPEVLSIRVVHVNNQ